nr:type IA DNA topoisomerase [Geomicrobium sp. JCM 19037]
MGDVYASHQFEETHVTVDIKGLEFKAKGIVERVRGWKALLFEKGEENERLPNVQEGEEVGAHLRVHADETKPPKPYTNGQLINLMKTAGQSVEDEELKEVLKKTAGIGTEATRSSIIETLIRENYIEVTKNIVRVTPKGRILCEAVDGTLLSKADMTAEWEQFLQRIGQGEKSKDQFLTNIEQFIHHLLQTSKQQVGQLQLDSSVTDRVKPPSIANCPACGGAMIKKGRVYGCDKYKEGCKQVIPIRIAGKTLTENQIRMLCTKRETRKIKGFVSKNKKKFSAVLTLDENGKIAFQFD